MSAFDINKNLYGIPLLSIMKGISEQNETFLKDLLHVPNSTPMESMYLEGELKRSLDHTETSILETLDNIRAISEELGQSALTCSNAVEMYRFIKMMSPRRELDQATTDSLSNTTYAAVACIVISSKLFEASRCVLSFPFLSKQYDMSLAELKIAERSVLQAIGYYPDMRCMSTLAHTEVLLLGLRQSISRAKCKQCDLSDLQKVYNTCVSICNTLDRKIPFSIRLEVPQNLLACVALGLVLIHLDIRCDGYSWTKTLLDICSAAVKCHNYFKTSKTCFVWVHKQITTWLEE